MNNPRIAVKEESSKSNSRKIQKLLIEGSPIPAAMLYDQGLDEIPMLLAPLFPKVGLVGLFGSSDTGKSAFLRQFALAISSAIKSFLGFDLRATHHRVLYVTTEDDHYATGYLLRKQSKGSREVVENIKFLFDSHDVVERVEQELKACPVDCVIVDAFGDVVHGDLNQLHKVRECLDQFSILATRFECLFLFLHHSGKGKQNQPPHKDNAHGSNAFPAKMRLLIEFRLDSDDDQLRHLCIVKGNYVTADEKSKSYLLRFDENMTFENTGVRVPYDQLIPRDLRGLTNSATHVKRVLEHSSKGMSSRKITSELAKEGIKTSKSAVANIIKQNASESKSEPSVKIPEVVKPWPPKPRNVGSFAELYMEM